MTEKTLRKLTKQSDMPTRNSIEIGFKGYTEDDCKCEYCLHYKSRRCRAAVCCCIDETIIDKGGNQNGI